ncbi:MAG: hypothetical protein OK452_02815 [Thaumarchaeota archaeon]|nr:hypothetical protein [Nitrososphaerota archaeon]
MMNSIRGSIREVLEVSAVFIAVGLTFTAVSVLTSDIHFKIGTFRPIYSIPPHLVALSAMGLAVGFATSLFSIRFSMRPVILSVVLMLLFDLDHIPAALGIPQPIRPAHSLLFLGVVVLAELILLKKPIETGVLIGAAFLGHLAVDTGLFPLFYPFSMQYYALNSIYPWLYVSAFVLAIMAGLLTRFNTRPPNFVRN